MLKYVFKNTGPHKNVLDMAKISEIGSEMGLDTLSRSVKTQFESFTVGPCVDLYVEPEV